MRKIIISLICVVLVSTTYSNEAESTTVNYPVKKTVSVPNHDIAVYRLFSTQNMWTFIKLNTQNGKMWQVQYDVEGNNRLETFLNVISLVSPEKEVTGRFTLYSTENFYTFILLDQIDGRMWQVQWSMEFETRFVIPIK